MPVRATSVEGRNGGSSPPGWQWVRPAVVGLPAHVRCQTLLGSLHVGPRVRRREHGNMAACRAAHPMVTAPAAHPAS